LHILTTQSLDQHLTATFEGFRLECTRALQLSTWDLNNHQDRRALMIAFTSLIHAVGNDGDIHGALTLFERARRDGVVPDLTMYSTLVSVLLTNDEIDLAQKVCTRRCSDLVSSSLMC